MFCKDLDTLSTELHKLSEGIAIVLAAEKDFDYKSTTNIEDGMKVFVDWYLEYNKLS